MKLKQKAEELGLDRCEFDDECDFCDNPQNGSYAKIDRGDVDYYVCGKCILGEKNKDKKI